MPAVCTPNPNLTRARLQLIYGPDREATPAEAEAVDAGHELVMAGVDAVAEQWQKGGRDESVEAVANAAMAQVAQDGEPDDKAQQLGIE